MQKTIEINKKSFQNRKNTESSRNAKLTMIADPFSVANAFVVEYDDSSAIVAFGNDMQKSQSFLTEMGFYDSKMKKWLKSKECTPEYCITVSEFSFSDFLILEGPVALHIKDLLFKFCIDLPCPEPEEIIQTLNLLHVIDMQLFDNATERVCLLNNITSKTYHSVLLYEQGHIISDYSFLGLCMLRVTDTDMKLFKEQINTWNSLVPNKLIEVGGSKKGSSIHSGLLSLISYHMICHKGGSDYVQKILFDDLICLSEEQKKLLAYDIAMSIDSKSMQSPDSKFIALHKMFSSMEIDYLYFSNNSKGIEFHLQNDIASEWLDRYNNIPNYYIAQVISDHYYKVYKIFLNAMDRTFAKKDLFDLFASDVVITLFKNITLFQQLQLRIGNISQYMHFIDYDILISKTSGLLGDLILDVWDLESEVVLSDLPEIVEVIDILVTEAESRVSSGFYVRKSLGAFSKRIKEFSSDMDTKIASDKVSSRLEGIYTEFNILEEIFSTEEITHAHARRLMECESEFIKVVQVYSSALASYKKEQQIRKNHNSRKKRNKKARESSINGLKSQKQQACKNLESKIINWYKINNEKALENIQTQIKGYYKNPECLKKGKIRYSKVLHLLEKMYNALK